MSKLDNFLKYAFSSDDLIKKQQLKNIFTGLMLEAWQEVGSKTTAGDLSAAIRKKIESL